eukprot:gene11699-34425_t
MSRFECYLARWTSNQRAAVAVNFQTVFGPDTTGYTKRLEGITYPFVAAIGMGLAVNTVNLTSWEQDTLADARSPTGSNLKIIAPSLVGDLQEKSYGARLWDISTIAETDTLVNFNSYHPYYKRSSVYNGKIMSLPVDGSMLLLYYNKDSLERSNISAPSTLEEVQTKGSRQGLYINPATRQQMLTSAAMHAAVRVLHTLRRYSAPPSDEFGCTTHSKAFARARCAMTIGPTRQWKVNSYGGDEVDVSQTRQNHIILGPPSNFSRVIGGVGVTMLPGSTTVLDRKADIIS